MILLVQSTGGWTYDNDDNRIVKDGENDKNNRAVVGQPRFFCKYVIINIVRLKVYLFDFIFEISFHVGLYRYLVTCN